MLVTRLRYLVILDNINQGCNFADHHALGLDLQGLSGFEKWIWPFVDAAHDHDTIEEQLFNLSTHWCIFLHWLAHLEQRWDTLIYLFNGHQLEWGRCKKSIFWQPGLGSHVQWGEKQNRKSLMTRFWSGINGKKRGLPRSSNIIYDTDKKDTEHEMSTT